VAPNSAIVIEKEICGKEDEQFNLGFERVKFSNASKETIFRFHLSCTVQDLRKISLVKSNLTNITLQSAKKSIMFYERYVVYHSLLFI